VCVARLLDEARAVNAIDHPNIVDIFAFGELPDGRAYVIMELLDGETLYELMERRRLGSDEIRSILEQVCEALAAAHDKGVIHRDIKPANIFVLGARGGRRPVKLLDFGLAKPLDGGDCKRKTRLGSVLGTPSYMSPEQCRQDPIDGRGDVYALGIVAYELYAGRVPFDGDNPLEVMQQQCNAAPEPLRKLAPEAPRAIAQLIMRMLEKDPAARPTIAQVATDLNDMRHSVAPTPQRKRRWRRWLVAAPLAGLLAWAAHALVPSNAPAASEPVGECAAPLELPADPAPRSEPARAEKPRPESERPVKRSRRIPGVLKVAGGRNYVIDPFVGTP
jgi:serine/threonine-protein kinase